MTATRHEIWFLTGSQRLYGPETLDQVAEQSREIADALDALGDVSAARGVEAGADRRRRDPARVLDATTAADCVGVIAWMHTFSPAKMWIGGLDALRKPLLHLHTQANATLPWADDRHGLHEPQPGRARRPRVRLHPDPAAASRARRSPGTSATRRVRGRDRHRGPGPRSALRAAAHPAAGPLRRQHARRRRHRGRQGRGADRASASRSTPTASTTWSRVVDAVADADVDALVAEYERLYDVVAGAPRRRRRGTSRCATPRGSRSALRQFLDDGGFGAFTTNFEDLGGLRQLPGLAVQRLMADGYGFGGEGDWKTVVAGARPARRWPAALPGGTSFMEDYTYHLGPGRAEDPRRAHARGLPDHRRRPTLAARSTRWASAAARTRSGWSSRARPARPSWSGLLDLGDRFRLVANEIDVVPPDEPLPELPVARAVWKPAPDLATSAEAWLTAGGPHHTVLSTAVARRDADDLADMLGIELRAHRRGHHGPQARRTSSAGTAPTTGLPRRCSFLGCPPDVTGSVAASGELSGGRSSVEVMSSCSESASVGGPLAVINQADAALSELTQASWWAVGDADPVGQRRGNETHELGVPCAVITIDPSTTRNAKSSSPPTGYRCSPHLAHQPQGTTSKRRRNPRRRRPSATNTPALDPALQRAWSRA